MVKKIINDNFYQLYCNGQLGFRHLFERKIEMKKINGFISNSSSSSFILDFGKEISGYEDLEKFILPNQNGMFATYSDEFFSKREVLKFILSRIEPRNRKDVLKFLSESDSIHKKLFDIKYSKNYRESWCKKTWLISDNMVLKMGFYEACKYLAEKYVKENMKDLLNNLKNPYEIEISDNSSLGSTLERGDVLKKFTIGHINHH